MNVWTVLGILFVIFLILGVGLLSGRKVKSAGDFLTGGGQAGSLMVCGAIMGSLVSSQATIGTAQLAFSYGAAAWWFTLGAGVGCLFLALGYVKPLRRSKVSTELAIISGEYGVTAGSIGSVLSSVGIFLSVLAQVVACTGLLTVLFPALSVPLAALISIAVMCFYVIFGGAWGAGMGGIVKLILLYIASVIGLAYVLVSAGGFSGLLGSLNETLAGTSLGLVQKASAGLSNLTNAADVSARFANLLARGPAKDIGSGLSLLLGVLSTQTYAQAVWSGKSDAVTRRGALLAAFLTPPIGIAGTCIGLYMRAHYITQAEVDALLAAGQAVPNLPVLAKTIQVFPTFLLQFMPSAFAGIVLGTLLVTVIGGGAGLSLGMATILVKDLLQRAFPGLRQPMRELWVTRWTIVGILVFSAVVTVFVPSTTINDLGFLSMGLRAAVVFVPMTCALFLPGRVNQTCVLAAVIISPFAVLFGKLIALPFDPLFLGMAVSLALCGIGFRVPRHTLSGGAVPLVKHG